MAHYSQAAQIKRLEPGFLSKVAWGSAIVGLLCLGFYWMSTDSSSTNSILNSSIERVYPAENELALRQEPIGVDLSNRAIFRQLMVDNKNIPDDQLDKNRGTNQYTFRAGAGKEFTSFTPGRHCATVSYETLLEQSSGQVDQRTWCFNLH